MVTAFAILAMFLFDRPLLTRDWKSESVTDGPTNQPTNILTWVGARDTRVSKKDDNDCNKDEATMERSPTWEKMKVSPCLKRVQHCINLLT